MLYSLLLRKFGGDFLRFALGGTLDLRFSAWGSNLKGTYFAFGAADLLEPIRLSMGAAVKGKSCLKPQEGGGFPGGAK